MLSSGVVPSHVRPWGPKPVYLERLLQINIATMAALGTLLLGMGQRSPALPLWMLTAAVASVWSEFTKAR